MGDVALPAPTSPWGVLAAQVNRFGVDAPAGYQFVTQAYPLATGNPDLGLATTAATIYQRRAADAYSQFHDAGSLVAITRANQALADPLGFVTANLSEVTTTIRAFADALGIAPAPSDAAGSATIGGLEPTTLYWIAGIGLALWILR